MNYNVQKVALTDVFANDNNIIKKVQRHFGSVESGNPEIVRGTLYEGKDPVDVLKDWNKHLGKVAKEWPSLYEFETDMRAKVGPMSYMQPLDKRMDDIGSYWSSKDLNNATNTIDSRAVNLAWDEFKVGFKSRVKPMSFGATLDSMKLTTQSGSPYYSSFKREVANYTIPFTSRWDSTGEVLLTRYANNVVSGDRTKWYVTPAVLGWRGQEGGPTVDDTKQRTIWMFPFAVSIAELSVYIPLIARFQLFNLNPAWLGSDAVDYAVTNLFATKGKDDLIICTDFTKYDQHFNRILQNTSEELINRMLDSGSASTRWLENWYDVKYRIPLMISDDTILTGRHGMGSGSGGTNFDETMAHRALQHAAAMHSNAKLNRYSMCLGDDGILSYPGITPEDVTSIYTDLGKVEMQLSKQTAASDWCVYLRRWYHRDYILNGINRGVYPSMRALGRLMYQERWYYGWSAKKVALRQLSILENCRFHPMRDEFLKFCIKGDKYRLGLDIPGFMDNIQREFDEARSDDASYLSYLATYDRRPLSSWWVVNELRKLR
nr:MAG: RNA-dependent RNA polymerase [Porcine picobirnavirus]